MLISVRGTFTSGKERLIVSVTKHGKRWTGTIRVTDGKLFTRTYKESGPVTLSRGQTKGTGTLKLKVRVGKRHLTRILSLRWSIKTTT